MPTNSATDDAERCCPEATQIIMDLLSPLRAEQVTAYLEKTGWRLQANHFTWKDGWTLHSDVSRPTSWVYIKPDLDAESNDDLPFVVEVPGREEIRTYLQRLQFAVERIAAVEQTTFVTVVCHLLEVEQLVLLPKIQGEEQI